MSQIPPPSPPGTVPTLEEQKSEEQLFKDLSEPRALLSQTRVSQVSEVVKEDFKEFSELALRAHLGQRKGDGSDSCNVRKWHVEEHRYDRRPKEELVYDRTKEVCVSSSLAYAVHLGHYDLTEMLVKSHGPEGVSKSTYKLEFDGIGSPTLILPVIAAAISLADASKKEGIFKLLHESKAAIESNELTAKTSINNDEKPWENWNLLYEASYNGCLPIVMYLNKHSRSFAKDVLVDVQDEIRSRPGDKTCRTPLHCAIWRGHRPVVEALLQMGAPTKVMEVNMPERSGFLCATWGKELQQIGTPIEKDAFELLWETEEKKDERWSCCQSKSKTTSQRMSLTRPNTWKMLPGFHEAIDRNDGQMISLLVKEGVNVFDRLKRRFRDETTGEMKTGYHNGCIDYIFWKKDPTLVAAIVDGLRAAKDRDAVFQHMTKEDLLKIMVTPSCDAIFDVIFRKMFDSEYERENCSQYHDNIVLTISEGRRGNDIANLLSVAEGQEQQACMQSFKKFVDKLFPDANARESGAAPISIRQCEFANVHTHPMVAYVLANPENNAIFEHKGAKAIIKHLWGTIERWYFFDFACNLAMALLFACFAALLSQENPKASTRYILGACATVLLIRSVCLEILQLIGTNELTSDVKMLQRSDNMSELNWNHKRGSVRSTCSNDFGDVSNDVAGNERDCSSFLEYFKDVGNWLDLSRLFLTGFGIIMILNAEAFLVKDHMGLRICLGVVMFLLWTRVLFSQRCFERIPTPFGAFTYGPAMFPILQAVAAAWPFLFMMFWPAVGFAQGYYMLGVYPEFFRAATLVYRAGFLGDIDTEELEDIDPSFSPSEDDPSVLETEDPEWTEYHVVFILFTVVVSLAFTIIMMNILIGVLSEAYIEACRESERFFLHSRAATIFEKRAVSRALDMIFPCCKKRPEDYVRSLMPTSADAWVTETVSSKDVNNTKTQDFSYKATQETTPGSMTPMKLKEEMAFAKSESSEVRSYKKVKKFLWYCESTVLRPKSQ